jgi:hypothetical protein
MTKRFGGTSVLIAALLCGQGASAQDEQDEVAVAVPGLQAVDGDDGVANELTGWLRAGTSAVQGWQLHPAMVSLEQFMIVHACEKADESCLSKIAQGLGADRLISGALSKVNAEHGDGFDFQADLFGTVGVELEQHPQGRTRPGVPTGATVCRTPSERCLFRQHQLRS